MLNDLKSLWSTPVDVFGLLIKSDGFGILARRNVDQLSC